MNVPNHKLDPLPERTVIEWMVSLFSSDLSPKSVRFVRYNHLGEDNS